MNKVQKEMLERLDFFTNKNEKLSKAEQDEVDDLVLDVWMFAPDEAAAAEHAFSSMALSGLIDGY
jgi:hypothetical protein